MTALHHETGPLSATPSAAIRTDLAVPLQAASLELPGVAVTETSRPASTPPRRTSAT
jgi:hypothetical protein